MSRKYRHNKQYAANQGGFSGLDGGFSDFLRKFRIPLFIIGGLLGAYGLKKTLMLKEVADGFKISLAALPKIHRIDLTGLKISAALRIDNPTLTPLKIQVPQATVTYKGKEIAKTAVNSSVHTIEPQTSKVIDGIMVEAGMLNIISLVGSGIISDPDRSKNIGFEALVTANGIPIKVSKVA